ncbi:segregation and condensation protein A [Thermosipho atlanticus]|uniref:Segregation and condensation protein A n=1 Tax=Thermosipho atlanticus DSM 15807 TaxID=1123380 RepID=A0A1M5QQK3_9BACT|nr:ScpA family protein [Thermosipho atlanticus]SHH16121.1 condensin subunit ScpA [Thermosipho atlanticus DSM 15807]
MELLFKFENFEGPLDLILFLVKKNKLSIREIPLSLLADEFMNYLNNMKKMNLNITSEFIATASYLMELKSKSLLPRSNEDKEFQYSKENFYAQVEQYAKLKEMVENVRKLDNKKIKNYPINVRVVFPKINEKKFEKLLKNTLQEIELKQKVYQIKKESLSIEVVMTKILNEYIDKNLFDVLKESKNRYEFIVKFLAILELIKLNKIFLDKKFKIKRVVRNAKKSNSLG